MPEKGESCNDDEGESMFKTCRCDKGLKCQRKILVPRGKCVEISTSISDRKNNSYDAVVLTPLTLLVVVLNFWFAF
jgi:hypothetical protein